MDDKLFQINFMKQNFIKQKFDPLRTTAQLSGHDVKFFESLLSMQQVYIKYKDKTFLQLLISENKNIIYIVILLNHLVKTPEHHSMINHIDSDGLTAFIQMIILRPNQVKDVIKIFMSFPCFDKSFTYNGKTAEDYINESPLEQRHKDKLLKTFNPVKKRKTNMIDDDSLLEHDKKKRITNIIDDSLLVSALLEMSK